MAYSRVAAVTGANKGIGFAIVRNLALSYPKSSLNNGPLLIYLTARDRSRGEQAIKDIHSDAQLQQAKALKAHGGLTDIQYQQLDVSDEASIAAFAAFIGTQHPDGIDVLVNNAGVALDGFDASLVAQTLACNYYGTLHMTQHLLPHMRNPSRIVNVASLVGKLNKYSPALTAQFRAAAEPAQATVLMEGFQASVAAGTHKADGWPESAYAVSKAGVIGLTRAMAPAAAKQGVLLSAVCPGYVKTDMTKGRGARTVDQGARTPVMLALGELGGAGGEFWQGGDTVEW